MDAFAILCIDLRLVCRRRCWGARDRLGNWNRPPRQGAHLGIRRVGRLSLCRQPNRRQWVNL